MKVQFGTKIYWSVVTLIIIFLPTLVIASPRWFVEIYSSNRNYIEVRINTDDVPTNVLLKDVGVLVTFYNRENNLLGREKYTFTGPKPKIPFLKPKQTYVQWFPHPYDTAESVTGDDILYPIPGAGGGRMDRAPIKSSGKVQKDPNQIIGSRPSPLTERPKQAESRSCHDAVQGKIAWDYERNTAWNSTNVDRLCRGAGSDQPARCFNRVMHGGVSWGGGTQWRWENAIDLCEGTADADATIRCFQQQIRQGQGWGAAIAACDKRSR